jgi:DNA polymerase
MDDEREEVAAIAAELRRHLILLRAHGTSALPMPVAQAPTPLPIAAPIPIQAPAPVPLPVAAAPSGSLAVIRDEIGDCRRCKLHSTRKNIVFGVGNEQAPLVFIGEAPGANEDLQGIPFCGDAGNLLTKMIEAMGWGRDDVYIANLIKCRPPGNRNPASDEIEQCEPFLIKQLGVLRPRMIVALGKFAAQALLRKPDTPISALRGKFHEYQGIQVMPTYHPAYLLRTPSAKRVVWEDLQLVMGALGRMGISSPRPMPRPAVAPTEQSI